jgi:hypothetical protein
MIKKEKLYPLFLVVLLSCKTPAEYFGRPKIDPAINSECIGYRDGEEVDTTNFLCVDPVDYDMVYSYCEDKEFRLFKCLKYGRCK